MCEFAPDGACVRVLVRAIRYELKRYDAILYDRIR